MKKISFLNAALLLGAMVSFSCTEEVINVEENNKPYVPVKVQVSEFSMTVAEMQDTQTRAAVNPADYDQIKALSLAFYASDGTLICDTTQLKSEPSTYTTFGEFNLLLPIGSYTMVVVGRGVGNGDEFSVTSPTVAGYSSERARETFCKTQEVTVTGSTPLNLSVTLSRIVANLFVYSTDVRPTGISKIRTTYSAGSKSFNPTTGLAIEDTGFSLTNSPSANVGATMSIQSFTFLSTDEQTMTITLEVLDEDDNVLITKDIPNVSLKRNRKTKLRGPVFTPSASSASFLIETSWLDDNTINF